MILVVAVVVVVVAAAAVVVVVKRRQYSKLGAFVPGGMVLSMDHKEP